MPTHSAPSRRANRKRLAFALGLTALAAAGFMQKRWFTANDITTGQTPDYPELTARVYAADLQATATAAKAACQSLKRWKLVAAIAGETASRPEEADAATLHAEARTVLFSFVDDVTVRFEPLEGDPPRTRVVIRSHSRVGKGDLGENARHIAALQAAMDARLPKG